MKIELVTVLTLPAYVEHQRRHCQESGTDGDVIFMPFSTAQPFDLAAFEARRRRLFTRPPGGETWARAWGLWDGARQVGHCELSADTIAAGVHRAGLGMGIERPYRRSGWGRHLLQACLTWAEAEPSLDYVDLGVFAANAPAIALYRAFGFVETGRTPDRFRVDGVTVDDISMTRSVKT